MSDVEFEFRDHLRLDEFLMLGDVEAGAAVEMLTPVFDAHRRRRRKTSECEVFNRTVGLVIANALVADGKVVHYSRRFESYSGASPYRPSWLGSKRLIGVIDCLAEAGLLEVFQGRWGGAFSKGIESSFSPAPSLLDALNGLGIGACAVLRDRAAAPVIVLRGRGDGLIRYDPTDTMIMSKIEELRAYNAFIAAQNITLGDEPDTPRFGDLTRIYNDGNWHKGGRHFGGWWQSLPSALRSSILINGEPTVELDYGGFMTRALYHLTGRELPCDDPYNIPSVRRIFDGLGIEWDAKGRKAVKTIVNIAISAKSRNAFITDKSVNQISLPVGLIKTCVPLVLEFHHEIGEYLLKGMALDIMNLESDICQNVICCGMDRGIVVLPIFDSFVVSINNRELLRQMMNNCYRELLNKDPSIH